MNTNKDEIQAAVVDMLRQRKKARVNKSEADYLAGACAALQAVFGEGDKLTSYVPPMWVLGPLTGRSVLE